MTLYDFRLKSDHEQYDIIFTQGNFIDHRLERSQRFALYAVDKFFVEVEYNFKTNEIIGKRSFLEGELLNKYSQGKLL